METSGNEIAQAAAKAIPYLWTIIMPFIIIVVIILVVIFLFKKIK